MCAIVLPPIRIPGLPDGEHFIDADLLRQAYASLRDVVAHTPARKEPGLRVGVDLVIDVLQDDGTYKRYELIARGTLLRDPRSREVWPFLIGREMARRAVPRLVAASESAKRLRKGEPDTGA